MAQYVFGVYPPVSDPVVPLRVLTTSVPVGTQNSEYPITTFQATGGSPSYTWGLVAPYNTLPTGMNFNTATGVLDGTPTATGTFTIQVQVQDNAAATANSNPLTLTVLSASQLNILTSTLPNAKREQQYNATLSATGGTAPYTWSLVAPNNVLPTGLNLVGNTIVGVPTTAETKSIVLRVTDSAGSPATDDSGIINITVANVDPLIITTPATVPNGENTVAYSLTLATSGGFGDVDWVKLSGDYPTGISLDGETGVLSGTPTVEGSFNFTLQATDSEARTATKSFTLTVQAFGTVEGPYDYFTTQAAHGTTIFAPDLTNQAVIDSLYNNPTTGPLKNTWIYNPGADVYHTPKDAVRFVMAHSLANDQLYTSFPPNTTTGKTLVMVDVWWGPEFLHNIDPTGEPLQHKFHQHRDGGQDGIGGNIYVESRMMFRQNEPAPIIGHRDLRTYNIMEYPGYGDLVEWGLRSATPYDPTGAGAKPVESHRQRYGVWTRHWYEFQLDVPGTSFTSFKNCTPTGAANPNALGTRDIVSTTSDGLGGTIIEVEPWEWWTRPTPSVPSEVRNGWLDVTQDDPVPINVTISGHSNAVLNGTHTVYCVDSSHLSLPTVDVGATVGTGGTCSKHFHMFTWWQAEQDEEPFLMYNQIPIKRRGSNGRLIDFDIEMNTSKDIIVVKGWFFTTPPTIASPTEIDTDVPHGMSTNEFIHISGCDVIETGSYPITVTGPTTFTIPVAVSSGATLNPLPLMSIQDIDLGDIATGDSFTLQWRQDISAAINFSADMSADILAALRAKPIGFNNQTVVTKQSDHVYRVTFQSVRTNTLIIAPTGFTPGGVTKIQQGTSGGLYSGSYGRATKALVGYYRGWVIQRNRDNVTLDDTTIFKKPVDG